MMQPAAPSTARSANPRRRMLALQVVVSGLASALALALADAATAANPTTLSINCTPKGLSPGTASSCVSTVTDSGPVAARVPPAGTVTFTTQGSGTFDPNDTCALEPSGAFSSKCTLAYTPTAISGGTHRLLATYNGEDGHGHSTSAFTLTVTPVNDDRDSATLLPVPGKSIGTTEGATYADDDPELCSDAYAPVWYSLRPAQSGRVAVRLTVKGLADSVVAVFRQERSKLTALGCDVSNVSGVAGVPFDAVRGTTYLVAVAAPWSALSGEFTIESVRVPAARFPGMSLARDRDVVLDPLLRPNAAFSARMPHAATYRIAATARGACVHVSLLRRPSASSAAIAESDGCSGFLLYTPHPGASGPVPLLVSMPEGRVARVHVAVRTAEPDDLAPGVPLLNGTVRHGRLAAREADVVDTYRFRVDTRADATLTLSGRVAADLLLFDEQGKQLACACDGTRTGAVVQALRPGTYLTVVRARPAETGTYSLTLRLRQPTATVVRLTQTTGPRSQLQVIANVRPRKSGQLVLELERFDPLSHWQFAATSTHMAHDGQTSFRLHPAIGGWRIRVRYSGTLSASASVSGWVAFTVDRALETRRATRGKAACRPDASLAFTVGALTVTCGGAPFGQEPKAQKQTPGAQLRSLRSTVAGIPTLKDPFKSNLLDTIDAAIAALAAKNLDEVRAQLDRFVTQLRAAPLQAQLTPDQRTRLTDAAKRIEAQLGP
jgi:hypothetical protein